jgi:hypothetical protein
VAVGAILIACQLVGVGAFAAGFASLVNMVVMAEMALGRCGLLVIAIACSTCPGELVRDQQHEQDEK